MKNFATVLMLAAGTPMLLMGDEVRRSQGGNNNAYSIDDETSWLDWRLLERHRGLHRFVAQLAAFRQRHDVVPDEYRAHAESVAAMGAHRMARGGPRAA